jgi:RNA polymerase sigma-70 factor, ECF subfamily
MTVDIETAIQELTPRLLRYCRGRSADTGLAEEIAQESLVALIIHWRLHGPPASINGFVFSIARRRVTRALARRRLWVPIEYLLGKANNHADPEAETINKAREKQVLAAIRKLPVHGKESLLLVAVADFSDDEAAGILGISQSAQKVRVYRARRRLAVVVGK